MIKKISAAIAASLLMASFAYAAPPACDDATPVTIGHQVGDTTTASGGVTSIDGDYSLDGNQKIWTFVAGSNVNGKIKVHSTALTAWAIFITQACNGTATGRVQSFAIGDFASNELDLEPSLYTAGNTYYVIFGALEGLGTPVNGPYDIEFFPTFPVSLQSFSID